jgi:hypothetical protein
MEGKMTESARRAQDAVRATSFFQELVPEPSTRNPPHVDSIIPPSATHDDLVLAVALALWIAENGVDKRLYIF